MYGIHFTLLREWTAEVKAVCSHQSTSGFIPRQGICNNISLLPPLWYLQYLGLNEDRINFDYFLTPCLNTKEVKRISQSLYKFLTIGKEYKSTVRLIQKKLKYYFMPTLQLQVSFAIFISSLLPFFPQAL